MWESSRGRGEKGQVESGAFLIDGGQCHSFEKWELVGNGGVITEAGGGYGLMKASTVKIWVCELQVLWTWLVVMRAWVKRL